MVFKFKLISAEGYPCETHQVITEDGYILDIFRIPPSTSTQPRNVSFPPVILFHGLAQSSAAWVVNHPKEDALGFHLANKGFDVWLANQRGTPYSSHHTTLKPSSPSFWEFGNHEVGVFDLPSIIDYILNKTKQTRVNFVGFSTANAAFLILNSKKPEYNEKVRGAVFLAPAGIYYHGVYNGLARSLAPTALRRLEEVSELLRNVTTVAPILVRLFHWSLPVLCSNHGGTDLFGLCLYSFRTLFGDDKGLISQDKLSSALGILPNVVSVRTLTHLVQQMVSGEFTEFDFGVVENEKLYSSLKAPPYKITNVQVPIAIIIGGDGDLISTEKDARTLAKQLPKLADFQKVDYEYFTHASFHLAKGAGKMVNDKVSQLLEKFI